MEVKPGYKQTEVGVIPGEWVVKTFTEMFNFSGGYSASRDQLSSEGHCYLHYGDIHGATKTTVDVRADFQDIPKLNIPLNRVASKSLLNDGDVVFVDASEDDEGTSKHIVVVNKDKQPFISGLHTIVAKSTTDELAHEYRRYCFQTAAIRHQFLFYAVGTKVSGISKTNIAKLKMPVPKVPEQRAIATALSDVDGLLGGLDRLIAKKRDLKQAAMQQLLTGQTRLPGFHGEWEVKRLGEICEIAMGRTPPRLNQAFWGHGYKWLSIADLQTKVVSNSKEEITELAASTMTIIPKGTLLMSFKLSLGRLCFTGCDLFTNEAICSFNKLQANAEFLYYVLGRTDFSLYGKQAVKGYTLNSESLRIIEVTMPPLPEQTAIAEVLTEMDAELATLTQQREKTRALKQAMMQELLTGRTRLV